MPGPSTAKPIATPRAPKARVGSLDSHTPRRGSEARAPSSRAPKLVVLRLFRLVLDPSVSEWPGSRVAEGLSDQTNRRKSEGEYSGSPDQREDQVLRRGVAVVVATA